MYVISMISENGSFGIVTIIMNCFVILSDREGCPLKQMDKRMDKTQLSRLMEMMTTGGSYPFSVRPPKLLPALY